MEKTNFDDVNKARIVLHDIEGKYLRDNGWEWIRFSCNRFYWIKEVSTQGRVCLHREDAVDMQKDIEWKEDMEKD